MSEIVNMSQKIRLFVEAMTKESAPGERVVFESMMTFAYMEGYRDGYARGYTEAMCEERESNEY